MNKIEKIFSEKKNNILSVYFTAGFPGLNDTPTILEELSKNGVDLIEIGMPFSDPLADGPTIQHSSEVALKNGMTLNLLFQQLESSHVSNLITRPELVEGSHIPLLLMGYINPILQYGIENFCKKASELGISGVIIPDLPMQEYLEEYKSVFDQYGLLNIFLITPQTSAKRVRFIDSHSKGFIYMVSSASTTGAKENISDAQEKYFKRIQAMKLKNPTLIGFGISDNKTFSKACSHSNGAIIGSAFIKAIENSTDLKKDISNFIENIKLGALAS